MRLLISCLFVLVVGQLSAENKVSGTFELTEPLNGRLNLHEFTLLLPEMEKAYTIEEVLSGDRPDFVDPETMEVTGEISFYWMRLHLTNTSDLIISGNLRLPSWSDSVWVYTVIDNSVVDFQMSGTGFGLRDKNLRGSFNDVDFSIDPGKAKTIYCRVRYLNGDRGDFQKRAYMGLFSRSNLASFQLDNYFGQGVFIGLMILFCLVSVFLYVVFKERIFLYFAGLMLSFGLYFLGVRYVFAGQFNLTVFTGFRLSSFATGGIVCFLSLFAANYLQFRSFFHKTFKWYAFLTILLVLSQMSLEFVLSSALAGSIENYLIAGWMLFTITLIVIRVVQKDKSARVMLLSIVALFIGGGAFLINSILGGFIEFSPIFGFQLGTIAFASILFYSLFDKYNFLRAEQQRMEKLDELKSRFFANISHEFRTPLTLMLGPIQQVMEKAEDPQDKLLLGIAHRNAGRQLSLVNQLLDLAKAESGKLRLRAKEQDYIPLLKGTVYSFASLAEQRGLQLEVDCPETPLPLFFDQEKMEQIIINLVSNACKFTPVGGRISVKLKTTSTEVQLVVADNGQGINPERLPYVFDRFFRAGDEETETAEGHGIGLALVKELVELHHGTITLESKLGKGTTVSIELPRGKAHLEPGDLVSGTASVKKARSAVFPEKVENVAEVFPLEEPANPKEKTHILLIEDNADVRVFIRQRLDPAYHITEAADGEAGIQQALAEMPDLIISDVMMPRKDGYEVCQALKTDVRTCHIPVILLTAKAGREEKLEGLETGADDYLTKPFDAQELELRVANLIRLREQLRQRFATAISIRPSEIVTNSLDQEFLENALAVVEANMGNEDFNLDAFTRAVGMSRPNLNRKLRAIVNQSSNQFIQSIRLQRAADLLRRKTGNVGEIAFQTGFRSTAYFVKCFGDHYGVTPGNYAENPPEME